MAGAGYQGNVPRTGRSNQIDKFFEIFLILFSVELYVNQYCGFAAFRTLEQGEIRSVIILRRLHRQTGERDVMEQLWK
jgi:hypothetical protein